MWEKETGASSLRTECVGMHGVRSSIAQYKLGVYTVLFFLC